MLKILINPDDRTVVILESFTLEQLKQTLEQFNISDYTIILDKEIVKEDVPKVQPWFEPWYPERMWYHNTTSLPQPYRTTTTNTLDKE